MLKQLACNLPMPRFCIAPGCRKVPHYGDPETGKKTHCAEHKPDGYVDLTNPPCAEDGCTIRASFGDPTTGKKTHCSKHGRMLGYVDVKHEQCNEAGCKKMPHYGDPEIGKKTYCAEHKPNGYVDLTNRRCLEVGCQKKTTYGDPATGKATHCSEHGRPLGYVDVKHDRCAEAGCQATAHYGDPKTGQKTHCAVHKPRYYIDLTNSQCKSSHCATIGNPAYDGYCTHCFARLFPLDPRTAQIRIKTKEIIVRDALVEWYGDAFIHDKALNFGCDCAHKRSVDFRRLIGNTIVAIEVDEGQHKRYDAEDENVRYDDLFVAFGGKWMYIRFNPDPYLNTAGERRPGFFNSKKVRNSDEVKRRLLVLRTKVDEMVARAAAEENDALLERVNLFFDGSSL